MRNRETSNEKTKVRIALSGDEDEPRAGGECVWAKAVPDHPGQYTIHNNAFEASLRIKDVVQTELDGCGMPQVVGISHLHPGPVTTVQIPPGTKPYEIVRIADSWLALGSEYSESAWGALVTAWGADATAQSISEVVAATAPGWRIVDVATAPIRAKRLRREIDTKVDRRTFEDHEAEYLAFQGLDDDDERGW